MRKRFPNPDPVEYRRQVRAVTTSKVRLRVTEAFDWARQRGVYDVANIAARRLNNGKRLLSLHQI